MSGSSCDVTGALQLTSLAPGAGDTLNHREKSQAAARPAVGRFLWLVVKDSPPVGDGDGLRSEDELKLVEAKLNGSARDGEVSGGRIYLLCGCVV